MAQKQQQKDRSVDLEEIEDHWGEVPERSDRDKYPEDAPARTGKVTPPSGQGGATPHDGVSYQDMFAPNPEPSESAAEKGRENDEIGTGDTNPVRSAEKPKAPAAKETK